MNAQDSSSESLEDYRARLLARSKINEDVENLRDEKLVIFRDLARAYLESRSYNLPKSRSVTSKNFPDLHFYVKISVPDIDSININDIDGILQTLDYNENVGVHLTDSNGHYKDAGSFRRGQPTGHNFYREDNELKNAVRSVISFSNFISRRVSR